MASVLFVCTGNMYRSPVAAETFRGLLLRDDDHKSWKVSSAGTWTTEGRNLPESILALARSLSLNLAAHQTRMVDKKMMEENDLIIVMEEGHREALRAEFPFASGKIYLLSKLTQGISFDIADPAAAPNEVRAILTEVMRMVETGYNKIIQAIPQ